MLTNNGNYATSWYHKVIHRVPSPYYVPSTYYIPVENRNMTAFVQTLKTTYFIFILPKVEVA